MKKNYHRKYGLLCLIMLSALMGFAQRGSISGRATDEDKQALPGVTIMLEGTSQGTTTDGNGNFKITGIAPGTYTVRAQFVGYVTQQTSINVSTGNVAVNFSLKTETTALGEVVVIGYGTQRKKDLTGSVATVTAKEFNKGSLTTPEQLISGKVAGVQIISSGGAPGAGFTSRI